MLFEAGEKKADRWRHRSAMKNVNLNPGLVEKLAAEGFASDVQRWNRENAVDAFFVGSSVRIDMQAESLAFVNQACTYDVSRGRNQLDFVSKSSVVEHAEKAYQLAASVFADGNAVVAVNLTAHDQIFSRSEAGNRHQRHNQHSENIEFHNTLQFVARAP